MVSRPLSGVLSISNAGTGRAWTVNELRNKSYDDLWSLWWVCAKERNRIATQEFERSRVKAGYGEQEATLRDKEVFRTLGHHASAQLMPDQVKLTQRAIKHALTERWYAWQAARKIAAKDPQLSGFLEVSI
jgi:large subunit ribosomal protein L47